MIINNRVLYVAGRYILASKGFKILESKNAGKTWSNLTNLSITVIDRIIMYISLLSRLFRKEIHYIQKGLIGIIIIIDKSVYKLTNKKLYYIGDICGSKPLAFCYHGNKIYYGEYRSNKERTPIHIWKYDHINNRWTTAWQFNNIRHIHGVYYDPIEKYHWVTTGDLDNEVGIYKTSDNFTSLDFVVGNSQQLRTIQLLFTKNHVYFGSDTPLEENHIYRMNRDGNNIEKLAKVGGSIFFGCKIDDKLFFSTAVEPSRINKSRYVELWGSQNGESWNIIKRFKKDIWPKKIFQYGQIYFPSGPGDSENLWFSTIATNYSQHSIKIPIKNIFNKS